MKFHHIGVAVKDIDATAAMYEMAGYRKSGIVFDPIQNVNICWLTKEDAPIVELLAPVDEASPVCNTLEKNGVTPYHCCYVVDNIDETVKELRKQRYVLTGKPEPAVAFCGSRDTSLPPRRGSMIITGIPFSAAACRPLLPAWVFSSR